MLFFICQAEFAKKLKKVAGGGKGWLSSGNTPIGHKLGQIDPVYRDNITTTA
jgi:hypothetical protein